MLRYLFLLIMFALLQTAKSQTAESDTVWSKEIGSEVKAVKFSPDGQFIYAAAIGRKPMKLSTETGDILQEYEGFKFEGNVFFMAMDVSSDGKWLICGAYGNKMHIFDTETGLIVKTLKTDYGDNSIYKFTNVAITWDKRYIIAIYTFEEANEVTMNGIVIWDAISGELIKTIESRWAMKVAVSPMNNYFCVSYFWSELDDKQSAVELYDLITFEKIKDLGYHDKRIYDIAFSPDGSLLASGGWDGVIKIWDVNQKKLVKEIKNAHGFGDIAGYIYSLAFINNSLLVSGGTDHFKNNILFWNWQTELKLGDYLITRPNCLNIFNNKLVVADYFKVTLLDFDELVSVQLDKSDGKLSNIPNPFHLKTEIQFVLPNSGIFKISILDTNSNEIEILHKGFLEQGEHKFQWLPKGVSSGVYYCIITGQNFSKTLKIILEK